MLTLKRIIVSVTILYNICAFAGPIPWSADSLFLNPSGIANHDIYSVAPWDLNSDGITDLVLLVNSVPTTNPVRVYLGRDAGNPPYFEWAPELQPELESAVWCRGITIRDLDMDGYPNLVLHDIRDSTLLDYELDSTQAWTFNPATFQNLHIKSSFSWTGNPAFFDLDGDGDLDFITNAEGGFYSINLECYLNNGTPQHPLWQRDTSMVSRANNNPQAYTHFSPVIMYANGDSLPDLLIAAITEGYYWLNLYTGGVDSSGFYFGAQSMPLPGSLPDDAIQSITVFDYNHDGLDDLFLLDQKNVCRIYPATGDSSNPFDGHFYLLNSLPAQPFTQFHSIDTGQEVNPLFFMDGYMGFSGIVVLHSYLLGSAACNGMSLYQQTHPAAGLSVIYEGENYKDQLVDIDGNGLLEYISVNHIENQGFFYVYENSKPDLTGKWSARPDLLENFQGHQRDTLYLDINFADLDGDDDPDFFCTQVIPVETEPYTYLLPAKTIFFENTGDSDSSWSERPDWKQGLPDAVFDYTAFTDLDFDGDLDLVIKDNKAEILYAYGNTGSAQSPVWSYWGDAFTGIPFGNDCVPSFTDLDNDGKDEMVLRNHAGNYIVYSNLSDPLKVTGSGAQPTGFELYQNYPNPFNAGTTISFRLSASARTALCIFDVSGRRVARLVHGVLAAGAHHVIWDGTGPDGMPVSSGIYFYRLSANTPGGAISRTGKMVLVK